MSQNRKLADGEEIHGVGRVYEARTIQWGYCSVGPVCGGIDASHCAPELSVCDTLLDGSSHITLVSDTPLVDCDHMSLI